MSQSVSRKNVLLRVKLLKRKLPLRVKLAKNRRVVVLGFDGAELSIIEWLMNHGMLPNFEYLKKYGLMCRIQSTIPYGSPTAWSSFMTGLEPEEHGVYSFISKDGSLETSMKLKGKTVMDIVSRSGGRVISVNLPMTYPSWKINGLMISWIPIPLDLNIIEKAVYPSHFIATLLKIGYCFEPNSLLIYESLCRYVNDIFNVEKKRVVLLCHLLRNYEYNLFITVFVGADRLQHIFWKYVEEYLITGEDVKGYARIVLNYYKFLDRLLGRVMDFLDLNERDVLITLSDHGFGPAYRYVSLSKVLTDWGFIKPCRYVREILLSEIISPSIFRKFLTKFSKVLSFLPTLRAIKTKLHFTGIGLVNPKFYKDMTCARLIDFDSIEILDEQRREYILMKLINYLYRLRDPKTERRIIKYLHLCNVHRTEAPDIIAIPMDGYKFHSFGAKWIKNAQIYTGTHTPLAMFASSLSKEIPSTIVDIAPLILRILTGKIR